jgi:asparagine synthase (glutamine-hydrolysing)
LSKFVPESYKSGKKQGFSAPDASWFKGESIEYIKSLLMNRGARIYEFMQYDTIQGLMNEHFTGATNRRLLIWSLLCFEWWLKIFA